MRIVLAVAGFGAERIDVAVEANQLTVTGRREADEEDRAFLHRGIAARGFSRVFVLADGMEVGRAWLDHGLLYIEATRPKARDGSRRIAIETVPQPVSRRFTFELDKELDMLTDHLSTEAFAALGAPNLVYVRPIRAAEIMADTPVEQIRGFDLKPEQILYAVHRADGARLAVMGDRDSAIAAALAHELAPVSVH